MEHKLTTVVMLTGAAARISQEVALLDKLMEKKGLVIQQENTLLSGFSSGSLNILALNACFRANNPLSWDQDYKEDILWKLTNADVFSKEGKGHLSVYDTTPLRNTLNAFLDKMGLKYFGDFDFDAYVLTFSDRKLKTEWARSKGIDMQQNLIASDLFMASTAMPIVFPWQRIGTKTGGERNFPDGHFSDGGTAGQFKHYEDFIGQYVLENGPFKELHIISPMRGESATDLEQLHEAIQEKRDLKEIKLKLEDVASNISFDTFLKFLESLQSWQQQHGPIAENVYVNIPQMDKNFGILNFDTELEQYNATCEWIEQNPDQLAVPLDVFVSNVYSQKHTAQ